MEIKPICSKCEAKYSSFLTTTLSTVEGNVILIYCGKCGAVQGVVRK
jgi:hypothetical protein